MITAFQQSAFQDNAFQIGVNVGGGGGGKWTPYAYGLLLARLEAEAKERDRKQKEAEETALAALEIVTALDAPIVTELAPVEAAARVTLDRLMPKVAPGPDLELEEFAEFMKLLAEFEEFA